MSALSSSSSSCDNATMCSNSLPNPNAPRKVRVVAKIRGHGESERGFSWISVNKPNGEASDSVTVSIGDQTASRKDSYEMDYCFDEIEGNEVIFSREVKPLISGVFDGCNATVVAYGARGTGKTSVIQGSSEKLGLAALAITEILSMADANGASIAVSFYEVYQDRVWDLIDSKQQTVFVLEDKQGKIQLKGLSQVPVRSISDFQKLCVNLSSSKPLNKTTIEHPHRGHKGLIVHISSSDNNPRMGKMNFVDLAGYEDVRRKSIDGSNLSEQNKINTSVYAFLNVIQALSVNGSHVPYRESKLARILQGSLSGFNKILMITCLNPTFCQDSLYMIKLAARCCQKVNQVVSNSRRKTHGLTKAKPSIKSQVPKTISATEKKKAFTQLRVPLSERKVNRVFVPVALNGRKLFSEKSKPSPSTNKVENSVLDNASVTKSRDEEENVLSDISKDLNQTCIGDKEVQSDSNSELTVLNSPPVKLIGESESVTPKVDVNTNIDLVPFDGQGRDIEEENNKSPPISARLRELSNNLKALCNATPSFPTLIESNDASNHVSAPIGVMEPKTPVEKNMTKYDQPQYKNFDSPSGSLSVRSTGIKNSLVKEYLKFLNTAEKEDLKKLRGIGEKRATWILEMRDESVEPFKRVDDLKNIGLSRKQVKDMMKIDIEGLSD